MLTSLKCLSLAKPATINNPTNRIAIQGGGGGGYREVQQRWKHNCSREMWKGLIYGVCSGDHNIIKEVVTEVS